MKNVIVAVSGLVMLAGGYAMSASPAEAQARGAPRGTYAQSCQGSYVNQGRLYADCYDEAGRVRATSIELNRCSNDDVANRNGLLVCGNTRGSYEDQGRPGQNNRPGNNNNNRPGQNDRPGSNWNNSAGSITVFRDSNYRGRSVTVDSAVPDMRQIGLNDAVSSLRVTRGTWEVCEHANYRGRCETVSGNVSDLNRMNFNDRISSMRPLNGRR